MKITLENVDATFKDLLKKHETLSKEEARKRVKEMTHELASDTPVDTGYAKSRWNTIEVGNVFVTENDAPYIEYLNQGGSKQAPAYFIERVALKYGTPLGIIAEVKKN